MEVGALVATAVAGDRRSWDELVARYTGLVWSIARAHRLSDADSADVVQTTWLKLVEHLDSVADPERVGGWLATTARRECLRTIDRAGRMRPTEDEHLDVTPVPFDGHARLVVAERDATLWDAFATLPEGCQLLLRILMTDPPPAYEDVSAAIGRPIGSIGPTRARCLERLRREALARGIRRDGDGSLE